MLKVEETEQHCWKTTHLFFSKNKIKKITIRCISLFDLTLKLWCLWMAHSILNPQCWTALLKDVTLRVVFHYEILFWVIEEQLPQWNCLKTSSPWKRWKKTTSMTKVKSCGRGRTKTKNGRLLAIRQSDMFTTYRSLCACVVSKQR